jgi:ABC-2 type transport system ATP-binding protein
MVVLHHGRIVAEGTPAQLRGSHDDRLRLELLGVSESATAGLSPPFATAGPAGMAGNRVIVTIGQGEATTAIDWAQQLLAAGTINEFAVNPASLEDVYIGLVGNREEDGGATLAASLRALGALDLAAAAGGAAPGSRWLCPGWPCR